MLPFAAPGIGKTTKGIRKSIAKRLANAPNKAARLSANDMGSMSTTARIDQTALAAVGSIAPLGCMAAQQ